MPKLLRLMVGALIAGHLCSTASALEQSECLERLKPIDERIASGLYSAQSVQLAKGARDGFLQMCGFMTDAEFAEVMVALEQMLPADPAIDAERAARQQRMEAEMERLDAGREARRAARAQEVPQDVTLPPVSAALNGPPAARTVVASFIDRDDSMSMVDILDQDNSTGKLRLLYVGRPSREQARLPSASKHYYVIEGHPDGSYVQHHVTSVPIGRTVTVALRRGYDEIVFQYPVDPPRTETRFERWSISGRTLMSSSDGPVLPWSGRNWSQTSNHFHLATSDGNVMFFGFMRKSRKQASVAWLKVSPDGEVLGQGERGTANADVRFDTVFHTPTGGAGVILQLMALGEDGIESDLETPLIEQVNDVRIRGYVFSERRLLIVGPDGSAAWENTVGRSFIWQNMAEVGRNGSLSAMEHAAEATARRAAENGANRSLVGPVSGGGRLGEVRPIGDGFGVLINEVDVPIGNNKVDRNWLAEYRPDGSFRQTELTAALRHLGAHLAMLDAPNQDTVYVLALGGGEHGSNVLALNSSREIVGYGRVRMERAASLNVLIADDSGVWIAGEGRPQQNREAVWLERLEFR